MQETPVSGLVIRVTGGEVRVRVGSEMVACSLRGRFRVKQADIQLVAGDRVAILREAIAGVATGVATIESVEPRVSWLSRYVEREGKARAVVANIDRLFVVTALADPPPRLAFLDRVLASAEWGNVPACVVFNKSDLAKCDDLGRFRAMYEACGYDVVATSATRGRGLDTLEPLISDGIYAFVGESGVGKTSLVNRLDPSLDLSVQEVGERTGRGRHTTSYSQLFPFRGGYMADTPGMQTFSFPGNDAGELAACFSDMAAVDAPCRFNPCTHTHEPGCAVKAARDAGAIAPSRYESFLAILAEITERAKRKRW
jgi:ribosome biogenesis GTPase / thiamine phosphate phosphatase